MFNKTRSKGCVTLSEAKSPFEVVGFFANAQNDNRCAFARDTASFNRAVVVLEEK